MVSKADIVELKSLHHPPQPVKEIMKATCILLGKPYRDNDWKRHLLSANILNELGDFEAKNCSAEDAQRAKDKISCFSKEEIKKISRAAASLFVLTESMINAVLST